MANVNRNLAAFNTLDNGDVATVTDDEVKTKLQSLA